MSSPVTVEDVKAKMAATTTKVGENGQPQTVSLMRMPLADPTQPFGPMNQLLDRASIEPTDLLCSSSKNWFAVANLANGKVGVFWEGHCDVFPNLEEATSVLNAEERTLLRFKAHE